MLNVKLRLHSKINLSSLRTGYTALCKGDKKTIKHTLNPMFHWKLLNDVKFIMDSLGLVL